MKRISAINLLLIFSGFVMYGQNPTCPSNFVYLDGAPYIRQYDPAQPLSATNPGTINIPTFGSGLALLPNLNAAGPSPTFYSISGGNYYYWNGTAWTSTGHSTGNLAAVNIGGCAGTIYNLVGGTGAVYFYNGTGNGTLLTTITNFNGGGPYDIAADCNCNFYVLNTNSPNQSLTMYDPSGQAQCTYSLQGLPVQTSGTGLAIVGNQVYVRNAGFYVGTISGSSISFTSVPAFTAAVSDFASCSSCYSNTPLNGLSAGGNTLLTCSNPTTSFFVNSPVTPVTYNWSGPGIMGATTGSAISLNVPGVYSCTVTSGPCNPAQGIVTLTAYSTVNSVTAAITPSGNVCNSAGSPVKLSVAHTSTSNVVTWSGPGLNTVMGTDTVNVTGPGAYTVHVSDPASGCTATDVVTLAQKPTVSMSLSSPSVCADNYNSSPNSLTLTASGASSYTLFTSSNTVNSSLTSNLFNIIANSFSGNNSPVATGTLVGRTNFCSDTATTSFSVIPNPVLSISAATSTLCPGDSANIHISGASSFTWTGPPGLDTYSGPSVVSKPGASSIYTVTGSANGCQSISGLVTVSVLPFPIVSVSPATATVCKGSTLALGEVGNATSFTWMPATFLNSVVAPTVITSPTAPVTYTLIGALNGCTASAVTSIQIQQPPVTGMTISQPTVCFSNANGSPNTVTITPSGANSYTLLAGSDAQVFSPNGPQMVLSPAGTPPVSQSVLTVTLAALSGVCRVTSTQTLAVLPNPVLTISPPATSICPGQHVVFTAYGAGAVYWLPPANYTLITQNSIFARPAVTSHYSVYGSSGGCNSATKNAIAVVLPVPELTVSPGSATVCAGTPVPLTVSGNAASYQWYPAAGLSSTTGLNVSATPGGSQTYTVVGTLNTCTSSAITTVSATPIPDILLSSLSQTVCKGTPAMLYAQGAASYKWYPADLLNTSEGAAVIAHPQYNTTITVHGFNGICTGSATMEIIVVKPPAMTISAVRNDICKGQKLALSVHGASQYSWSPLQHLQMNGSDSTVWAAPEATTIYTVTGANTLGTVSCYQKLSYQVNVIPIAVPLVSESKDLCEGEKTTLVASGGNYYSWKPAAGLNHNSGSGVVAGPSVTTIYTVDVSYNGFCGASTTVMVRVLPLPYVFAGRDTVCNRNDLIVLKATGTGKFKWVMGDGISCAECPETQVRPEHNSCYIVEATNEFGCKANDDVCIKVSEDFTIYLPNTFSPNGDGLNDLFQAYGENVSDFNLRIYDRWGQLIFSSRSMHHGWDGTLNGVICKPDIYTYVLDYTGLDRKRRQHAGHLTLLK